MGKQFRFKGLLTEEGWLENALVSLDEKGKIQSVESNAEEGEYVDGYALPGFQNAHSHAFQYAMAGLAEMHDPTQRNDDFWSWRNSMYQVALSISPDQLEAIATMLYAEMLRHGYTSVAEFHYLHHDQNGKPYKNLCEMGERLVRAAQKAGIRITLVPMFYQKGGFGQEAGEGQRRFLSKTIETYQALLESTRAMVAQYGHASLGSGIHSLRAVAENDVIQYCQSLDPTLPFHIHISEQLKEVEACLDYHGQRPVEWLLNNCPVNENYHLVHATHLSDAEVQGIAQSGANVVICPSTEGNLGDGLFSFDDFKKFGGKWSIGTDSHVGLNPLEELRILDYGQRTRSYSREIYVNDTSGDSGFNAIQMAWKAGRAAMGVSQEHFFGIGEPLDCVVMDAQAPLIATSSIKHLCNTMVYSADVSNMLGTMVAGEWRVQNARHLQQAELTDGFVKAMKEVGVRN